jgi:DNA polymerase-3 subunit delta'
MTTLRGHDALVAAFMAAAGSGRLHHAWLLAGPEGVGKARFAEAAALRLLADAAGPPIDLPGFDVPAGNLTAKLIEAGSHPDFQRLTRLFREKTSDYARNITIDQVRGLQGLFGTTSTFSARRVVIIDAIDDLERNAANALLKNLEEPPPESLFLLISHAPGRLLPTIRSRCRMLRFAPLDDRAMAAALRDAMRAGGGSPGRALRFVGLDIRAIDAAMSGLLSEGDPGNAARAALAKSLSTKSAQARYEAFLDRAPARIAAHARGLSGQRLADAIAVWEEARALADNAVRLSLDPQATVFELAGMMARLAPEAVLAKA